MKRVIPTSLFTLFCLLWTHVGVAGLVTFGGVDACASVRNDAYSQGVAAGQAAGQTAGYDQGFAAGTSNGIQQCQQDPSAYGITLGMVLLQGGYGETEPNDAMVSANALVGGVPFIGQSSSLDDDDWYYLVTTRPNQILTIDFSVPGRDPASDDVSGWVVEVTNSAGTPYASFTTDYITGNPQGDDEIEYPITLGLVGTYYVRVKPFGATVSYYPYNLAVVLTDSDLTSLPVAVNFFDTEVEPNNTYTQANPLASGVTMYGLINLTFDNVVVPVDGNGSATYGQGEPDWYVYETPGNEIITLSFCNKQVCGEGDWFVEVFDEQGAAQAASGTATPLVAFNTASGLGWPDTIHFGVVNPGSYYMRINHKLTLDAPCLQKQPKQECKNPSGVCVTAACTLEGTSTLCSCPSGDPSCTVGTETCVCSDYTSIPNCGIGVTEFEEKCWTQTEQCVQYGKTVEIAAGDVTSQYNFTWYATGMQPFTANTPAYEAYQARPSSVPKGQ